MKCIFGHKWTDWERKKQPTINPKYPKVKTSYDYQERQCLRCKKWDRERIWD